MAEVKLITNPTDDEIREQRKWERVRVKLLKELEQRVAERKPVTDKLMAECGWRSLVGVSYHRNIYSQTWIPNV